MFIYVAPSQAKLANQYLVPGAESPITLNCPTVAPFWVSETRQGYVVVVVVAVFTTVIITYYTIISTNSLYIMKLLRSAAST